MAAASLRWRSASALATSPACRSSSRGPRHVSSKPSASIESALAGGGLFSLAALEAEFSGAVWGGWPRSA
ncbi:MAG: hypothetical protein LBB76_09545 [Azoarcus sp.]|nr:hypothetical protein [Azoarcus sp.]